MEDRDGKKTFIIPKTHSTTKDVLINEKPDSRNVTDLFNDIKSCALEAHFDFRQNGCKSCDTIRNQKLQKLYNEKRIKMKKDQDPIERLAFHLITYRDVALSVANDGLRCEQLSFPIEKYLGNPKDGIHLSRRPDVLLTSSGAQGLYRFGLLVCKVLLGKGYATIPSENNNQLSAQLHYDHHFCKIQSINKEQHHTDDLLANSLIFCYEHDNFEPVSHPPQILPIAIVWYDLIERFPPELIPKINQESQHRNGKITNGGKAMKKKTLDSPKKSTATTITKPQPLSSGVWEGPPQESTTPETIQIPNLMELSTTKYPSHLMVPFHRIYSMPAVIVPSHDEQQLQQQQQQINPPQQIISARDPRLVRSKRESISTSSETIPLSPQHNIHERSLSDGSISTKTFKISSDEPSLITKSSSSMIHIPLDSSQVLIDPRLKTLKPTRNIFYLELQAVKHALQQQKRLNHYYDPKSGLPPKTSYTLVPLLIREVLIDEYERLLNDDQNTYRFTKHSNGIDYSSLYVSVVDCLNFGLVKSIESNQTYIDLEQNENKLAFEQIEISNELIQREKQLNSQQIRLRLREKRQRRIQQQIQEQKNNDKQNILPSTMSPSLTTSKVHVATGRQLLKEHQITTTAPNTHLSFDLLDFFSREYKSENRSRVKYLLAELAGIFMEKYHIEHNQIGKTNGENGEQNHRAIEESVVDDQTMNCVIDMDLDSPYPEELCDHDERFRPSTPPPLPPPLSLPPLPPSNESIYTQPPTSLTLTHALSNKPNKVFDDPDYTRRYQKLAKELKDYPSKQSTLSHSLSFIKSESSIPTEEPCFGQFESSSSENSLMDDHPPLIIDDHMPQEENHPQSFVEDESDRSRDELVKLLTKTFASKSSSPAKNPNQSKRSYDYPKYRRRSHDGHENNKKNSIILPNSYRRYTRPTNKKSRPIKSPQKKISSNRTVLLSNRSTISTPNQETTHKSETSTNNQNDVHEQSKAKRIKVDSLVVSPNTTDTPEITNEIDQKDSTLKSIVTIPITIDNHDCRRDLDEKRRTNNSNVSIADNSTRKSSRSRSRSKSKDHSQPRRQSSVNSHSSSNKVIKTVSESTEKSKKYSSQSSRSPSRSNRTSLPKSNQQRHPYKSNRDKRQHERQRSSDLSIRHHQQYFNQLPDRHELFHEPSLRNSLPSMYHQHHMDDLTLPDHLHHQQQRQPVRHKRFNYNHQSVADHPRFANPDILPTPAPYIDFSYPKSPPHRRNVPSMSTEERKTNSSYYRNHSNDRSDSLPVNYSDCFESKPSPTIEYLQMLLQNKTTESFQSSSTDYSVNETVKYPSSSTNHDNSHRSSSSYSSKT